jgi:CO/xanthine dehydrogenase Mo-binding subunit
MIAIDCGPMVNPDRVRSQMEGGVIMGAGLATSAETLGRAAPRAVSADV